MLQTEKSISPKTITSFTPGLRIGFGLGWRVKHSAIKYPRISGDFITKWTFRMQISCKRLNYALREAQPFPSTSITLNFSTLLSGNGKFFIKFGINTGKFYH